jgi:hypothetical protein
MQQNRSRSSATIHAATVGYNALERYRLVDLKFIYLLYEPDI